MNTSSPPIRTVPVLNAGQNSECAGRIRRVIDTAGRLLKLLGLLQRRPSWSGRELAERLGVDPRTVRRDVGRIRELGYSVDSTTGPDGGYRLGVGTDMPPLLLDEDEAMAVAVLLGVSAGVAVPGIERAALATLARVDRLLPPRLQRQVKALRAATVPLMGPVEAVPAAQLASFAQACEGNELVSFGYSSRKARALRGAWSLTASLPLTAVGTWSRSTSTDRTGGRSGWTGPNRSDVLAILSSRGRSPTPANLSPKRSARLVTATAPRSSSRPPPRRSRSGSPRVWVRWRGAKAMPRLRLASTTPCG